MLAVEWMEDYLRIFMVRAAQLHDRWFLDRV
jgi:hypothetical protein